MSHINKTKKMLRRELNDSFACDVFNVTSRILKRRMFFFFNLIAAPTEQTCIVEGWKEISAGGNCQSV